MGKKNGANIKDLYSKEPCCIPVIIGWWVIYKDVILNESIMFPTNTMELCGGT